MNTMMGFRASLLTLLARLGRVGIGVFALSLILSVLTPTLPTFASAHTFSSRVQVAQRPDAFQALSSTEVAILDFSGDLWLARAPFGTVPPPNRTLIASHNTLNIRGFQFLSDTQVLMLNSDGTLWLENAPFPNRLLEVDGNGDVFAFQVLTATEEVVETTDARLWLERTTALGDGPPSRTSITTQVNAFQALSDTEVLVQQGSSFNDGALSLYRAPFGTVPSNRTLIDLHVDGRSKALSDTQILVEDNQANLWLERAPFGSSFPPARTQIDRSVLDFQMLSATQILVRGGDEALWLERAPFGSVPPPRSQIDANVLSYQTVPGTNATQILVEDLFTLWLESGPF